MFSVETNIPAIKDKLLRIANLVDGGYQKDARSVMQAVLKRVKMATPRSKSTGSTKVRKTKSRRGGQRHLREGWKLRIIGGGSKDKVGMLAVIYNDFTHDPAGRPKRGALLKDAAGRQKDYTLLDILEYGSRPHVIRPSGGFKWRRDSRGRMRYTSSGKGSNVLVFEVGGQVIFARRVSHPGTPAFGMVRLGRVYMVRRLKRLNRQWARKLGDVWRGGYSSPSVFSAGR